MESSPTATPWRRFRRLMALMLGLGLLGIAAVAGWLAWSGEPLRLHMLLAMAIAILGSLLLAGLLMGLVFLSARSGHDDAVIDPTADLDDLR